MKAGFWEILLIVILVLILFGHSKIPDLMKNLASGINVFKKELKTTREGDKDAVAGKETEKKAPAKKKVVTAPVKESVSAKKAAIKPTSVAKKASSSKASVK